MLIAAGLLQSPQVTGDPSGPLGPVQDGGRLPPLQVAGVVPGEHGTRVHAA